MKDMGSIPGSGISPGGGHGNTPVLLPRESHGQRSLVGHIHGVARSQTQLKWLSTHISEPLCHTLGTTQYCTSTRLQFFKKCLFYVYQDTTGQDGHISSFFPPILKSFISFNFNKYCYSFFPNVFLETWVTYGVSFLLCSQLISALLKFNSHLFAEFCWGGKPTWHSLLDSSLCRKFLCHVLWLFWTYIHLRS